MFNEINQSFAAIILKILFGTPIAPHSNGGHFIMNTGYVRSTMVSGLFAFCLLVGVGVGSSSTAQAQYPDWQRDRDYNQQRRRDRDNRDWDRDNRDWNRRGRTADGYSDYGGSYQLRQTALNAGYNEGMKAGRKDAQRGERFNYRDEGAFQSATKDYSSRFGDRELYRTYFRQAFVNGYSDGYRY
jgi:hypothetical protein